MEMDNFEICTTQARLQAYAGTACLVDLREPRDAQALQFDAPHIVRVPFSEFERRWQELPQDRDLVLVCRDGKTSQLASEFLRAKNLTQVKPMRGGVLLWMQRSYPVIGRRFENCTDAEPSANTSDEEPRP